MQAGDTWGQRMSLAPILPGVRWSSNPWRIGRSRGETSDRHCLSADQENRRCRRVWSLPQRFPLLGRTRGRFPRCCLRCRTDQAGHRHHPGRNGIAAITDRGLAGPDTGAHQVNPMAGEACTRGSNAGVGGRKGRPAVGADAVAIQHDGVVSDEIENIVVALAAVLAAGIGSGAPGVAQREVSGGVARHGAELTGAAASGEADLAVGPLIGLPVFATVREGVAAEVAGDGWAGERHQAPPCPTRQRNLITVVIEITSGTREGARYRIRGCKCWKQICRSS